MECRSVAETYTWPASMWCDMPFWVRRIFLLDTMGLQCYVNGWRLRPPFYKTCHALTQVTMRCPQHRFGWKTWHGKGRVGTSRSGIVGWFGISWNSKLRLIPQDLVGRSHQAKLEVCTGTLWSQSHCSVLVVQIIYCIFILNYIYIIYIYIYIQLYIICLLMTFSDWWSTGEV